MASSLSWFTIQRSLGDPYDVTLFAVCLLGSDEHWVYDQTMFLSINVIWVFSELFYAWLNIFVFLFKLLVWLVQLDWYFLQWEKCLALGSILRCPFPVTVGAARHVLYCAIEDKKMGLISYFLSLSLYIMSSCLKRYSVLLNLIL